MDASALSRQRLDYVDLPDGSVKAILTVSLPGGVIKRFEAITTPQEAEAVEGEIIGAELAMLTEDGEEIGSFFGKIFKAVKHVVKKVASSKVFKVAAAGLAIAAPVLGPLAPAALAASAGMGVASKLASAGVAAAKGAKKIARALTQEATNDARRLTKTPAGAASLLQAANRKRLSAFRIASGLGGIFRRKKRRKKKTKRHTLPKGLPRLRFVKKKRKKHHAKPKHAKPKRHAKPKHHPKKRSAPKPAPKPAPVAPRAPVYPPMSSIDLLARARAGRLKSNYGQPVSEAQLLAANEQGRVYWIQ